MLDIVEAPGATQLDVAFMVKFFAASKKQKHKLAIKAKHVD